MYAVRYHRFGGLEELRYEEAPTPRPGPGEVLVRVGACGVNRVDTLSREGQTPFKTPLPHISGSDVAGVVSEVGEGVADIEPGRQVVILPNLSCGTCSMCRAGADNMCLKGGIFGVMCDGGYAEYAIAPARNIVPLPKAMSVVSAAAMAIVGGTAWHMLVGRACLRQAEDLLIVAAGSGIGAMAVQIGKLSGRESLRPRGARRNSTS